MYIKFMPYVSGNVFDFRHKNSIWLFHSYHPLVKQPEKLCNAGHEIHIHMVAHPGNITSHLACLQLCIHIYCTPQWPISVAGTAETLSSHCFHCLRSPFKNLKVVSQTDRQTHTHTNGHTYKHTYQQTALSTYPPIYLLPTHLPTNQPTNLPTYLPT